MKELEKIFSTKLTENGDLAYTRMSSDDLANILFMSEYYTSHPEETPVLQPTRRNQLFAMMMRDPRNGLGRRDLGRILMKDTEISLDDIVRVGRFDDLWNMFDIYDREWGSVVDYLRRECENGNELCKKWMPRYTRKNHDTGKRTAKQMITLQKACDLASSMGMDKRTYGKFIKANTIERDLTEHNIYDIEFDKIPSLAMLKYYNRFNQIDIKADFVKYIRDVKSGKKKINTSVTTCYDVYRHRREVDADLLFDKLPKIQGSWIPVVDTSGSMVNDNDAIGKALSIGHYLAKCSSYAKDKVISFSSKPKLIDLNERYRCDIIRSSYISHVRGESDPMESNYMLEIDNMITGDCTNTDLGAVMDILKSLNDVPQYIIVLSDMEFDRGSSRSKDELMQSWRERGINTRIIWWNFNSRSTTCPETDDMGNIFLSGYNPTLLKYLGVGFDNDKFIDTLLSEYEKIISK